MANCEFADIGVKIAIKAVTNGSLTISNGTFHDALFKALTLDLQNSVVAIYGCKFQDNGVRPALPEDAYLPDGGGLKVSTTNSSVVLSNCNFNGNRADGFNSRGGAFDVTNQDSARSFIIVKHCNFTGNFADRGGAISAWKVAILIRYTLFDNAHGPTTAEGGALHFSERSGYGG